MRVGSRRVPDESEWADMLIAWRVCRHVKSNAIVLVHDGMALGVGAGHDVPRGVVELAVGRAGDRVSGSVAASDAFSPSPTGLRETLGRAGVTAVIHPGGSKNDGEVTAADALGMAVVLAGERHSATDTMSEKTETPDGGFHASRLSGGVAWGVPRPPARTGRCASPSWRRSASTCCCQTW